MWNHDRKVLLMRNGNDKIFLMLADNNFFEGKTIQECSDKYNKWRNTVFINNFKIEQSLGVTILPEGNVGRSFYINAFYSDGTLAVYNENVGYDVDQVNKTLEKLKSVQKLTINHFKSICSEKS